MLGDNPISHGPDGGKVLHLAIERDFGLEWRKALVLRVMELYFDLNIRVTDRRPRADAGTYGTVVVAWELPGGRPGFGAREDFWLPGGDSVNPRVVFALAQSEPLITAAYVGHEAGHAIGLKHDREKGSLMNDGVLTNRSLLKPADRIQTLRRTTAALDS